jgi:hypothetical protein
LSRAEGDALRVVLDGEPLPAAEAMGLWKRFSAWMEEHAGDLAGFAKSEGLASVHPEVHGGIPVLVASRTAPQRPYTAAPKKKGGGGPPGGGKPQGGGKRRR